MTKTKRTLALALALPLLAVATACDPVDQLPLDGVGPHATPSDTIKPAYPPPPPPPPPVAVDRV